MINIIHWNNNLYASFETSSLKVNRNLLQEMIEEYESVHEQWRIRQCVEIQSRRHRQKRINKKWLKKYGVRVKTVETPVSSVTLI